MNQIAVPDVEIEKIDVVEGFNSRQEMDPVELEQMAATIRSQGVLQPVSARSRSTPRGRPAAWSSTRSTKANGPPGCG